MTLAVCEDSKEEEGGGSSASRQTTAAVVASAGMLLQRFLARLSGRRRQQRRHVRRFRSSSSSSGPGARAAAGGGGGSVGHRRYSPQPQQPQQPQRRPVAMEQPEEEELLLRLASVSCSRCRSGRSCSCAALGLDQVDDEEDKKEEEDDNNREHGRTRGCADARTTYDGCWRDSQARQQDCGCADRDVLRRRPPEDQEERLRCWRRPPPTGTTKPPPAGTSRRLLPPSSYYLATLLLLSYSFVGMADACSSRSTPKPRPPTPTPRPNITFHMYTCPPDYAEWYCLNGATCFTVKIVDSLLYNCLCANGYIGQRCEFKDLDGSYLPSRQRVMLETASIAGAVTIAVFLAVITFISVYIHCKRKQKELRTSSGVDAVDGVGRDPELRPFCSRSRSLMTTFMAKNPNSSTTAPSIEQTRMPNWNYPAEASTRMCSVNENKRPSQ